MIVNSEMKHNSKTLPERTRNVTSNVTSAWSKNQNVLYILPDVYWMLIIFEIFWEMHRSKHPELFLGKAVLKICSKFTREHSCRSAISIKLQSNVGCPTKSIHLFLQKSHTQSFYSFSLRKGSWEVLRLREVTIKFGNQY